MTPSSYVSTQAMVLSALVDWERKRNRKHRRTWRVNVPSNQAHCVRADESGYLSSGSVSIGLRVALVRFASVGGNARVLTAW